MTIADWLKFVAWVLLLVAMLGWAVWPRRRSGVLKGEALRRQALTFNVDRLPGESDAALRSRLIEAIRGRS